MTPDEIAESHTIKHPPGRLKAWGAFLIIFFLIWAFIFYIGPWIRDSIPALKQLTEAVVERDIDTTTFFYSETKEFYEGERFVRESMELSKPKGYGVNLFFFIGILCCIVILMIGYILLPNGTNDNQQRKADAENR